MDLRGDGEGALHRGEVVGCQEPACYARVRAEGGGAAPGVAGGGVGGRGGGG